MVGVQGIGGDLLQAEVAEAMVEAQAGDGSADALSPAGGRADDIAEFALLRVLAVQVDVPDDLVAENGGEADELRMRFGDQPVPVRLVVGQR